MVDHEPNVDLDELAILWVFRLLLAMAIGASLVGVAYEWSRTVRETEAMQRGYIQRVDEGTGKVLWVKPTEERSGG